VNLNRRGRVGGEDPVYFGPGFGPTYTPPFLPPRTDETFPASREHVLPEQRVTGTGPWTYAMLLAGLGALYLASK
jgi:hypothetical protein